MRTYRNKGEHEKPSVSPQFWGSFWALPFTVVYGTNCTGNLSVCRNETCCRRIYSSKHGIFIVMSQHSSLKAASKIKTKRNVLKRFERVEILKKRGKWSEGDRGLGLPKTKSE